MLSSATCKDTVGFLWALITDLPTGTCLSLDLTSLAMALGGFVGGVLILQWLANRALAGLRRRPRQSRHFEPLEPEAETSPKDPFDDGGPIHSPKGFWGR